MFEDAPGPVTVDLSAGTATGEGTGTIVVPTYSGGIVGSAYDDVLTGTNAPDRIRGGGGEDRTRWTVTTARTSWRLVGVGVPSAVVPGADLTRRTRSEVDGGGGRRDVVRLRA